MFKLLANVKLFSRCTTLHSAGGNSVLLANSYAKPSSDGITQWTKKVAAWIETLIEADKKKIRRIQNEITLFSLESRSLPIERLKIYDLRALLTMSDIQRKKYYNYMGSTIQKQHNAAHKLSVRKEVRSSLSKPFTISQDPERIIYDVYENSLTKCSINAMKNRKVYRETMLNGPQLIFDCSFSNLMTSRESQEVTEQLLSCIAMNRDHKMPFSLQFSNMDRQSELWRRISKKCRTIDAMSWHFRTTDYVNQIPKDKLIILTPDSPNTLKEFKPNRHYVLGATLDRSSRGPLMMAKAKELGIQMAALPLSLYRTMQRTNRTNATRGLPLQNLTRVLLDVRLNGDWDRAFKHIPASFFK